ncbi:hypothetical protein CEUSTIGMA_g3228.t1 [Chlamydomonas eustigma]|uniref:sulfiredoxin n=1 Tax=Chlamydomonas eustigma TaxID=1157962 RepID=A0A250WYC3_9CHLO|nr:hypothetical protein CEUSTIGMA_g3228.t1 [Chlamydomonas eustigma]|eukprot:GAX75785.1 hypothetical protein CEUSTIGMA_g3228.t1 [Chlamydomonas eustigma]
MAAVEKHNVLESIFVGNEDAPIYDVPISAITRPLPSTLDESKVEDFSCKLKEGTLLTPIEVVWVEHKGEHYYFAFGGCHRWAAHKKLGSETIPARLIKVPAATIGMYLGASNPFRDLVHGPN